MKVIPPLTFPVVAIEGERDALLAPYRHAVTALPGAIVMPGDESALTSPAVRGLQQGVVDAWDAVFATLATRWAQTGCNSVLNPFYTTLLPERAVAATLVLASGQAMEGDKDRARVAAPLAAFGEWEWFKLRGDKTRLAHAFEILLADHRFRQAGEKRRNGLFTGTPGPYRLNATGRFMLGGRIVPSLALGSSWVDACGMQALAVRVLADMARLLGRRDDASLLDWDLRDLASRINLMMWSEDDGWYYDLDEHGAPLPMRTLAALFALLGGVAPRNRADRMLARLGDPTQFERAHPLSTVAASEGDYRKRDGTPVGVVRSEFNVTAWECFFAMGRATKGQLLCESHLRRVAKVLADSGELYLAYDPDRDMPAPIPDGNSGAEAPLAWAAAIQETLSVLFGIRPHAHRGELELCLHLDEKHRVEGLPFQTGIVNFEASATPMSGTRRSVEIQCDIPIKLRLRRGTGSQLHELNPGFHTLQA